MKPRQHENCEVCKKSKLFDLDDKIFLHGDYFTKEQLLQALRLGSLLEYYKTYPQAMNYAQFQEWVNKIFEDCKKHHFSLHFVCGVCYKSFEFKKQLKKHQWSHGI